MRPPVPETPLERFTDFTLTGWDALMEDLRVTCQRGFAIDGKERNIGMRCIVAPVIDIHSEAVAGIAVSGRKS